MTYERARDDGLFRALSKFAVVSFLFALNAVLTIEMIHSLEINTSNNLSSIARS